MVNLYRVHTGRIFPQSDLHVKQTCELKKKEESKGKDPNIMISKRLA